LSVDHSNVVTRALSLGFMLDASAFDLLAKLPAEVDPNELVERIIIQKKGAPSAERRITSEDLESFLPPDLVTHQNEMESAQLDLESSLEVMTDPTPRLAPIKADEGYKKLFRDRYEHLLSILQKRPDMRGLTTVQSAKSVVAGQSRKVAGLLSNRVERRGNMELTIDDLTGTLRIICSESVAKSTLRLPLDSLVVVEVSRSKSGQLFASSPTLPDIAHKKPTTSAHEVYAVFLSDLHVGSRMFLHDDFQRFILWLNGKLGDREMVGRIRYVVIAGDLVDGVGVYPNQEAQLSERDLRKQYLLAIQLLEQIPRHIQIVVSPGNHDAVRQALPQPAIPIEVAEGLYRMENVKAVGNPASVKLNGVSVLIYHGRSLDDIIATVPELSYSRPGAAMELLLRARHLAPTYGKRTALAPELRDMLVIDPVPDVMHCGHVHAFDVSNYRGTLLVNSGTWQSQTSFQANMGLEPTPSIIPIVNLSNLHVVRRNFGKEGLLGAS